MIPEYLYKDNREVVTELMRFGITPASMAQYSKLELSSILAQLESLHRCSPTFGMELARVFAVKQYGLEVEESA